MRPWKLLRAFLVLGLVPACTGTSSTAEEIAPSPGPGPEIDVCQDQLPVGEAPLRRLTRHQYNNAIRDLLGDGSRPAEQFPADEDVGGFYNNLTSVTDLQFEQYLLAAEGVALRATARLPELVSCDPRSGAPCAEAFIRSFGRRAFRRPLTEQEVIELLEVYRAGELDEGEATGFRMALASMLQSPHFLYHVEFGTDETSVSQVSDYELASRLSFFLWSSIPDEELLDAAAAGELNHDEQITAQVVRMVFDPRAYETVTSFHTQWLDLDGIENLEKDQTQYPHFTPALRASLRGETERFADYVVRAGDGNFRTLLTGAFTFLDGPAFDHYGVADPGSGAPGHYGYRRVELDPTKRRGILTQAGLMAMFAHADQTAPVLRGKFIRERILCTSMPEPPNDVDIVVPEVSEGATQRERLSAHREIASRASCHQLMDPIGFAFEHYDASGQYRDFEGTSPIDATGELLSTSDADGPFDGALELAERLADSEQVQSCMVDQYYRFALGRGDAEGDTCSRAASFQHFQASGLDLRELILSIARSDAFRLRAPRTE
ncbi:MAG: DUF1592 domain-containing protein [Myxococcota bacterium]